MDLLGGWSELRMFFGGIHSTFFTEVHCMLFENTLKFSNSVNTYHIHTINIACELLISSSVCGSKIREARTLMGVRYFHICVVVMFEQIVMRHFVVTVNENSLYFDNS